MTNRMILIEHKVVLDLLTSTIILNSNTILFVCCFKRKLTFRPGSEAVIEKKKICWEMKLTKWTRTRHMIKRAYHCKHPVLNELGVFKLLVQPENKNARHLDWSMLLRHCMCWITFNRHDLIGSVMRADRETKWAGLQKKLLVISATGWWWWRFTAESNPFNVSIEQAYRVPVRAASPHSQKWWCSGKWCTLTTTHRVTRKCSFSRPPARPDNVYQHDSIALLRHFSSIWIISFHFT